MTNPQFVKNEIKRYNMRYHTNHNFGTVITPRLDIWENFISVALKEEGMATTCIGYAKRNPNCDEPDEPNDHTGLSIATFRALKRIDGRTP